MSVMLDLSCGGCEATARVGPLRKRFHGTHGDWGFGAPAVDDPEALLLLPGVLDGDYGGTGGQHR